MFTASDGTHALAPGDLSTIYEFAKGTTGAGVTIAVAGKSDVEWADIQQFRSTFQLPPNNPQQMLIGDDPGTGNTSALQEAEADLEWVGGVAPKCGDPLRIRDRRHNRDPSRN
jgi:subtilase family serine protease